jgi:Flp pilus assembly protein TadD
LLEQARALRPKDAEVQVYLAQCESLLGQTDRAREILDAVLRDHPNDNLALRTSGQLALREGRLAEAEPLLRRALRVAANDYQASWSLAHALRQQGKTAEAKQETERANELKDRTARLGEILQRRMPSNPTDPALHAELGVLLLELGHEKVGESWLHSALRLDPHCAKAQAALAEKQRRKK